MNAPRALDPSTGLPFPEQSWKWKMANFFLEKWGRKLSMKILQAAQPVITIIVGHIANTPESEQVIAVAIGAAILGVIDMIISWLTGGKIQSLQRIQEDAEAERQEAPTQKLTPDAINIPRIPRDLPNRAGANPIFSRLASLEPPEQKDVVPAGFWVAGIRDAGSPHEFRKYFGSKESAQIYIDRAGEIYTKQGEEAEARLYQPGDKLPLEKQYD